MRRTARLRQLVQAAIMAAAIGLVCAGSATAAPVLNVFATAPTTASPGGTVSYFLFVVNVGHEPTNGDPLTITATLPPGMTALEAHSKVNAWDCSGLVVGAPTVTCTLPEVLSPRLPFQVSNRPLTITASVDAGASGLLTPSFAVSGGGAAAVETVAPTTISSTPLDFGVQAFDGQVTANPAGDPYTQAAGHPYAISTSIQFNSANQPNPLLGSPAPIEPVKDVFVDLPPGLVGNPTATGARCTATELANTEGVIAKPFCPSASQVGVTTLIESGGNVLGNPLPVFTMVPPPDAPARFGFNFAGTVVMLDAHLRSGSDYGLTVTVSNIPEALGLLATSLTFWGVPADKSHDLDRACPGEQAPWDTGPSCATEAPRLAFLRNPSSCTPDGVGLPTALHVDSWDDPGDFKSASFVSHLSPQFPLPPSEWGAPQGPTGCADVPFEPTFAGAPAVPKAGAPSGFSFDLSQSQSDDPDQIGTADLKKAVVALPAGLRVSPSSAGGLGACSPAQIRLTSDGPPSCPSSSKIGTMRVDTPLLDAPLTGSIYLAAPHDNPFGSLLSLYLVAEGAGVVVKLPGQVAADPVSGQLTATFDNNPQLPFSNLHLDFKGGPRAPLAMPRTCGTYTTTSELTSWSGATVKSQSAFTVSRDGNGSPCGPSRFAPVMEAGVDGVEAGKNTTFALRLTRTDDDEEFRSVSVTTPRGLLAKVAGVPLCGDADAKAGTCDERSRIGEVLTGAGAGTNPFYLPGRVYLTDAYNGGAFGLSIVVPAVAGPFDLGNVVVRAAIRVDRRTAQLRIVTDPLPSILQGITLQIRDIRVSIDRPRFMLNPTSCDQKAVLGTLGSTTGSRADLRERFQVGGCRKLGLRPQLTLTVGGKGHTHVRQSTPLVARLTQTPGQSNLKSVKVTLPLSLSALLEVVNEACTREQFDAGQCEQARTGSAVAVTPLLDKPLRGAAYFVKNNRKGSLPDLVVALRGQVDFDLVGRITIPGQTRLATTFDAVPDVPIKSFTLRLSGGKDGAVGVAESLCTKRSRRAPAAVVLEGQNGRVINESQRLKIRGCGGSH